LSFQVYSSLTGTFGGSLQNNAYNRSYPFTYSIPVANTWTTISVTIAGDTSGTWTTDNSAGIRVNFGLGVGSTLSGTAGSWSSGNYSSATGAVSLVGTNNATFYITGVQLEVGSSATGFEYRQYGQELALCQRYFENRIAPVGNVFGSGYASTTASANIMLPIAPKRTTPTTSYTGGLSTLQSGASIVAITGLTGVYYNANANEMMQQFSTAGSLVAGSGTMMFANGTSVAFSISAEL
jgi:hypothetical protein